MMIIIVKNEKQKHWSWSQRRASPLDAVADYHDDDDHDNVNNDDNNENCKN